MINDLFQILKFCVDIYFWIVQTADNKLMN